MKMTEQSFDSYRGFRAAEAEAIARRNEVAEGWGDYHELLAAIARKREAWAAFEATVLP